MNFRVVDSASTPSNGNEVLLVKDNWNDWFTWVTQFNVIVVDANQKRVPLGHVKIGRAGMTPEDAATAKNLPPFFQSLDVPWFSIGQSENYYETLNELGDDYRDQYLNSLRDVARNLSLLDEYASESVMVRSLLRDINSDQVRSRFNRLANGNAALTSYEFQFKYPIDSRTGSQPLELSFEVTPDSNPPTNVHVLIGRNGVGKTRCFDMLSRAFLGLPAREDAQSVGVLGPVRHQAFAVERGHGFAGLVTVSFSPFDEYGPLVASTATLGVKYAYVGLIREAAVQTEADGREAQSAPQTLTIKGRPELAKDFLHSIEICRVGARRRRWVGAIEALEADPLFEASHAREVIDDEDDGWEERTTRWFRRLSSGHSVVLLTITRLVELVEEKSLVLIDEPEGHLHPPLLAAFIRALSLLMINRNGVVVIATHSPVVLQEVPRLCSWVINRVGHDTRADRPELETFGENVGVLTREVFGLEVLQTGFYRLISEASQEGYEQVLARFGTRLGGEARSLARALSLIPTQPPAAEIEEE